MTLGRFCMVQPRLALDTLVQRLMVLPMWVIVTVAFVLGPPTVKFVQGADRSTSPNHDRARSQLGPMIEERILHHTNWARRRRGLPPLRRSSALRSLARHHSINMCETGSFRHESDNFPEGWRRFEDRMRAAGVTCGSENIAYRTMLTDPDKWARAVVKGWMSSSEHRKNILRRDYRFLGVGFDLCEKHIGYATQIFSIGPGHMPFKRK